MLLQQLRLYTVIVPEICFRLGFCQSYTWAYHSGQFIYCASRPTAATSNQDGELNQITDLIVWAQNIGWDKGRTEDLEIWLA